MATGDAPVIELVETWPVETTLDHPEFPDAHQVWIEMIDSAQRSLDFEHFYASTAPGSRLEDVIAAIERAAKRGVAVRCVFGKTFYDTIYPEVPNRLAAMPGVDMRIIDMKAIAQGVQHTKFFVVDKREAYLGSQNFDWRALTHIQELGVRIRHPEVVHVVAELFALDWRLARDGAGALEQARAHTQGTLGQGFPVTTRYKDEEIRIQPGISPNELLPDQRLWDLPALLEYIESARVRVRMQALSYALVEHDGDRFTDIDEALRRAAARGVEVQLLLSDWNQGPSRIDALQYLQRTENITVKLVTIPEHSSGFIPFARVIHSKLMTVDGNRSWVGTSNFSGDYFHYSRNIGLFFEGASITRDLDRFFDTVWKSEYAVVVDPDATYQEKRIAE